VRFAIYQRLPGRKLANGRCVAPNRFNLNRRRCTRQILKGGTTSRGQQGANTMKVTGRLGPRKLAPGAYYLKANPLTNRSNLKTTGFRILRP
jgi:hypothetical protein